MTIIVILSQPTPPVSLFDARQLSIMFSLILESSCLAAMPRLTNSTTACEDWQSHIPRNYFVSGHTLVGAIRIRTITSDNKEFVVVGDGVSNNVRECCDDLLLG